MSEDTPGTPPSFAAQAAAVEAAATPAPEPAPALEPEAAIEELPDGDTFDRAYVEKLRAEAAKHRTQKQEVMSHFEGYTDAERTRFLQLASELQSSPETALEEFQAVTQRLAQQLGKEIPNMTAQETPQPAPAPEPAAASLNADDVTRLVEERLTAERQASAQQDEVAATFAEAEALSDSYKDPAAKAHLFAIAQHNNTDLAGAHEILATQLQETIDTAIETHMDGLRTGKTHPPRVQGGDPQSGTEPVNWSDVKDPMKLARERAEERFRATYGS